MEENLPGGRQAGCSTRLHSGCPSRKGPCARLCLQGGDWNSLKQPFNCTPSSGAGAGGASCAHAPPERLSVSSALPCPGLPGVENQVWSEGSLSPPTARCLCFAPNKRPLCAGAGEPLAGSRCSGTPQPGAFLLRGVSGHPGARGRGFGDFIRQRARPALLPPPLVAPGFVLPGSCGMGPGTRGGSAGGRGPRLPRASDGFFGERLHYAPHSLRFTAWFYLWPGKEMSSLRGGLRQTQPVRRGPGVWLGLGWEQGGPKAPSGDVGGAGAAGCRAEERPQTGTAEKSPCNGVGQHGSWP